MRGRWRRRRWRVLAVVVALAPVACGVPTDDHPRRLADPDVPFGLLVSPTTATSEAPPVVAPARAAVFFVRGVVLEPVAREVAAPLTVRRALTALLAGPTEAESLDGMRSAMGAGVQLLAVELEEGMATLDLSREFLAVGGQEQILALAQLVFTATAVPDVDRVRIVLEGGPVEVPTAGGTLVRRPVTRVDYQPFFRQ